MRRTIFGRGVVAATENVSDFAAGADFAAGVGFATGMGAAVDLDFAGARGFASGGSGRSEFLPFFAAGVSPAARAQGEANATAIRVSRTSASARAQKFRKALAIPYLSEKYGDLFTSAVMA